MKILVLSSLAFSLVNFRGRLLAAMVEAGHEVTACAPDNDLAVREKLAEMGVGLCRTPMNRAGLNPLQDIVTLLSYIWVMFRHRPDIIIAYTQKPIIYGGLASRLYALFFRKSRYYALMSGLGYVFSPEADGRPLLRRVTSLLYRVAVAHAKGIFTFNRDDGPVMRHHAIVGDRHAIVQVPGSGIDIDAFSEQPLPSGAPVFLMISRMMRDKGVHEFAEAARLVKSEYPQITFRLVGKLEPENPTGISEETCRRWMDEGVLEYYPETRDVRPFLKEASVFVLPSYYREGLPRTLLEALATGRPLLTTDMPGCREPVNVGQNGWLVPPRDAEALAFQMMKMVEDPEMIPRMARASRRLAVDKYDVAKVNQMLMGHMQLLVPEEETAGWTAGRKFVAGLVK